MLVEECQLDDYIDDSRLEGCIEDATYPNRLRVDRAPSHTDTDQISMRHFSATKSEQYHVLVV